MNVAASSDSIQRVLGH